MYTKFFDLNCEVRIQNYFSLKENICHFLSNFKMANRHVNENDFLKHLNKQKHGRIYDDFQKRVQPKFYPKP